MNVPVPQDTLDAWARFADHVRNEPYRIRIHIARRDFTKARESLADLQSQGAAALVSMEAAGAATPAGLEPPPVVPLELLDTPAQRRLARALRDAYEAAVEVDKERGVYTPGEEQDGPATLPIVELLVRVEEEVYGPAGRGEGAGR